MFHREQSERASENDLGKPCKNERVYCFFLGLHWLTEAVVSKVLYHDYAHVVEGWGMYGKHFASMYEGSLYGAGAVVFAVMGYIIATQVPDKKLGSVVTLNPKKLADTLGEGQNDVLAAIEYLCKPDDQSTTKKAEGRRLIRVGEFEYQVVNGAKYRAIRDEEERRAQNREAQRRHREKEKAKVSGDGSIPFSKGDPEANLYDAEHIIAPEL